MWHTYLGEAVCCLDSDLEVELGVEDGVSQEVSGGCRGKRFQSLNCLHGRGRQYTYTCICMYNIIIRTCTYILYTCIYSTQELPLRVENQ